jgi:di/tricarboxylate transporter
MESLFSHVNVSAIVTLLILAGAIYGFISEKLAPDITALLALLALLLAGILTPLEAFSGFSHPATVSVAAMLVLSAGIEHSGALTFLARRVLTPLARSELLFTIVVMIVIAAVSAFVNNTAAVAIFIPVVVQACRRSGISTGRVLMPMSHAATFGGLCTLIGTSTNLVGHEYALSQNLPGFSMFELGKVGLPMLLVGCAYILLIGRRFLPSAKVGELDGVERPAPYLAELVVQRGSDLIGREVRKEHLERDFDVELLQLVRRGQLVSKDPEIPRYSEGDALIVQGPLQRVLSLAAREGLDLHRPEDLALDTMTTASASQSSSEPRTDDAGGAVKAPSIHRHRHLPLAEVVVLTTSGLIGRTLKDARFAERHDAVVLALRRRGKVKGRPSTTKLHAGDVIVVEGTAHALKALSETTGFLVVATPDRPQIRPGRTLITFLTVAGVVMLVSFGLLPIVTAATAGCAVLMLARCLSPREAYQAINMNIVFLLAGSLALGTALEKTGVTDTIAGGLTRLPGTASPFVLVAGFFLVAVLVSEFMSNSGTVPLLAPIAISIAKELEINPMSLIAAVTFGSSAAFAMPIGYQTSLMIYGPGGYRFKDFIRMGLPLDLILAALALWLIPRQWPL